MNIAKLMKQAQDVQARLQEKVSEIEVVKSVAGGMVEVTMAGDKTVKAIKIDREILDPEDPEMVQDLVLSAINDAMRQVDEDLKGALGGMAPGMGIPGIPGF